MSITPTRDAKGRPTGRWSVAVQYQGRRFRGTFDTLAEAQQKDLAWRQSLVTKAPKETSHIPKGRPQTLGTLAALAIPTLWRGKNTEVQSRARLLGAIGIVGPETRLDTFSVADIDRLVNDLLGDRSPATVNRYLSALHTLLAWGKTRGFLASIPAFQWQSEEEGRIRWITEAEEASLLRHLGASPVASVVKVAIRTGMRRNELLGLSKEDVEPSWVRLWDTKSKLPRSVPIDQETYDTIRGLLHEGMPTEFQLRYSWDAARKAMGLDGDPLFVFHACRHTCATRLVRANVNIRIVQRWLGHRRIETTLRYAHVNDEMLTSALDALNGAAKGPFEARVPHLTTNGLTGNTEQNQRAGVVKLADTQDLGSVYEP